VNGPGPADAPLPTADRPVGARVGDAAASTGTPLAGIPGAGHTLASRARRLVTTCAPHAVILAHPDELDNARLDPHALLLVVDVAHACGPASLTADVLAAAAAHPGSAAVAVRAVTDTLKQVDGADTVVRTLDRAAHREILSPAALPARLPGNVTPAALVARIGGFTPGWTARLATELASGASRVRVVGVPAPADLVVLREPSDLALSVGRR